MVPFRGATWIWSTALRKGSVPREAVGVDLSAASLAIFAELPPDASWLCQAQKIRARRVGGAVSVVAAMFVRRS